VGISPRWSFSPTDRDQRCRDFRGATQTFTLPKTLTKSLKVLSRQEGVTLFMTLMAAFKTLLYHYTRQDNIAVGSPIANRNRLKLRG